MQNSIFIGIIQNIALLLSFTLIYDYFWIRDEKIKKTTGKIIAGSLIGGISVLLMLMPWHYAPGIVFDTRSIILSISGLFFGSIPTLVAMGIAMFYRIYSGGDGMWMGVAVILSSGFIGMIWRMFFPPRKIKQPHYNILLLGLLVHVFMVGCTVFLPGSVRLETFKSIVFPVLILYTPATMLIGILMLKRWQVWQRQKEKEQEEAHYRKLFEAAGEAILVAQDGYIRFANERLSQLLGRSYEEIRSRPFIDFIHADDREMVLQRHQERVQFMDVPANYSFRVVSSSGEVKWVEINAVVIEWEGQTSSLSFLTDVTTQRETSRQLVLAKNKAEESDRLKTIFLANMSHEVRTPMNAILGFSDLLKTERLPKAKREKYVSMIREAGNQLMNIINDIVDVSKLEVKQLNIINKPALLYDIFIQSAETLRSGAVYKEKEDVEFKLNFPDTCKDIQVNIDPYRIRQVIDNLLGNAIKYTQKGYIELSCICALKGSLVDLEVHVKDTGSGIPEEKKGIVFERFRQVEENQYREGAGLGLSIAKGIIELMGGTIGFESQVGIGTDFYFRLQLDRTTGENEKDEQQEKLPDLKGRRIIIAEDDITSFYLINEYLSETGAEIDHAADGEELVNMLKIQVPDLVLLDINMPKMDGYACLEVIRQNKYQCKIIAQTAYAMENEKEKCLDSGCHGYLSKPIDPEQLYREVENVLNE